MHVRELLEEAKRLAAERRIEEAKSAYIVALRHDPGNVDAMTGLGALLATIGMIAEARVVLEETLRLHPTQADAHRFLVVVFAALGDQAAADVHSKQEFALRPIHVVPFAGTGNPVRLLIVVAAAGINTRTARFCDRRLFETITVAAEFIGDAAPIPAHDVVFNAIGEAEGTAAIAAAQRFIARTDRRILNRPATIRATSRVENAARLGALPGVVTARTLRVARSRAVDPALARELGLPFLLRVPGHHTGEYFERVDDPAQLDAALAHLPGEELLAMSFLDARDAEGRYRKFRVMIVDGKLYPLHAAVGTTWKLHFFSGTHGEQERTLDEAFLADPQAVIGARAMSALHAIAGVLKLDYGGIDFAVDAAGNVLVFEANATMTVPEADLDPRFAYRTKALDAVADAVMRMFITSARCGGSAESA
jgi:glutathione synthase/RimK-type ligase-like ATP-grasp enzyme